MKIIWRILGVLGGLWLVGWYLQTGLDLTTRRSSPIYGIPFWLVWIAAPFVVVAVISFRGKNEQ